MKAQHLSGTTVIIIDRQSPFYGKAVTVKAVQLDFAGKPSFVLASSKTTGEIELKLADVSTNLRQKKIIPQTEMFI